MELNGKFLASACSKQWHQALGKSRGVSGAINRANHANGFLVYLAGRVGLASAIETPT